MSEFIQIHMLASYPPSNLNRDDLGRPKTATVGGTQRIRVSSQSLKRSWRTSEAFSDALKGTIGIRTKIMGVKIKKALVEGRLLSDILEGKESDPIRKIVKDEKKASEWAEKISSHFGKLEGGKTKDTDKKTEKSDEISSKNPLSHKQMVHFSPEEISGIDELLDRIADGQKVTDNDLIQLRLDHKAVDIALFGRMLADNAAYNTEAAVQVSHAITVHDTPVEDDYFTAVDDLNKLDDTVGAGHIGESEFGAGLFYTYICINRDLLNENLQSDSKLANQAIEALIRAASMVSPSGKQNSFASRSYASYLLVEKSTEQPRSLAAAFFKPVTGKDIYGDAVKSLEDLRDRMDKAYGTSFKESSISMNVIDGTGSMADIISFISKS
ncbi:MAG: CT1975-like protein [Euryarchaeota archaeon ADurb.Bin294]|jgi:CRISPR system Cascade subunit CasC|nr:type I-E CRISPR-associated protein Cas7/Cse4/CasC [Methanomicrobiales archaeon]OQA55649.1 MAG: CT1975-like protein [Euryarchaeota archaeon ADurb.Bin294]